MASWTQAGRWWTADIPGWAFHGPQTAAESVALASSWKINGNCPGDGGAPRPTRTVQASPAAGLTPASSGLYFPGLSPPLQDVLRVAVVAVVFAAVSGWGLIFPVCQSDKLRISESAAGGQPNPHFPCLEGGSEQRCRGKSWQPANLVQLSKQPVFTSSGRPL